MYYQIQVWGSNWCGRSSLNRGQWSSAPYKRPMSFSGTVWKWNRQLKSVSRKQNTNYARPYSAGGWLLDRYKFVWRWRSHRLVQEEHSAEEARFELHSVRSERGGARWVWKSFFLTQKSAHLCRRSTVQNVPIPYTQMSSPSVLDWELWSEDQAGVCSSGFKGT